MLGWVGRFDTKTLHHLDAGDIRGRRPVLLYGDSFAQTTEHALSFEELLNHDAEFADRYFLLNYGVGGYGLDQIYLTFNHSVQQYDDPFVIISLLTFDLDRTVLSVRIGQKPRFVLENDRLKLTGTPIASDPESFFRANPPQINLFSVAWCSQFFHRHLVRYLPQEIQNARWRSRLRMDEKRKVSERLILRSVEQLRALNLDFVFLIFHPDLPGVSKLTDPPDWRESFLRPLLDQHDIPYIWSRDIFSYDSRETQKPPQDYIGRDGHPTSYFNGLIAAEIKRTVMQAARPSVGAMGPLTLAAGTNEPDLRQDTAAAPIPPARDHASQANSKEAQDNISVDFAPSTKHQAPDETLTRRKMVVADPQTPDVVQLHTTAILPATDQATDADVAPVIRVEVRFQSADAGEVLFVWGLEKWSLVPDKRPPGTYVDRGTVLNTPMTRKGDTFSVEFEAPAYARVDFGFLITETASGQPVAHLEG